MKIKMFSKYFFIFFFLLTILSPSAHALHFYFLFPNGEGDTQSAQPYLDNFFSHLQNYSKLQFTGQYLNDDKEIFDILQNTKADIILLPHSLINKISNVSIYTQIAKVIPLYSSGAFEKYYLLTHKANAFENHLSEKKKIPLYLSATLTFDVLMESFMNSKWSLNQFQQIKTNELFSKIMAIAENKEKSAILLSQYEYHLINKLKSSNPNFKNLKTLFETQHLASPKVLVNTSKLSQKEIQTLQKSLIQLQQNPKSKEVLKNLRLSGFDLTNPQP